MLRKKVGVLDMQVKRPTLIWRILVLLLQATLIISHPLFYLIV
jgi:hypothetical protein